MQLIKLHQIRNLLLIGLKVFNLVNQIAVELIIEMVKTINTKQIVCRLVKKIFKIFFDLNQC
jgi:hypothetical protein